MKRDRLEVDQPRDKPTFVLNGIAADDRVYSEPGNRKVGELPGDVVGSITMDNNETIIFCTDGQYSYILIQSIDENSLETKVHYKLIFSDENATGKLSFELGHWIKGTWSIVGGEFRVIYFCDGKNPDRRIVIDDMKQYANLDDKDPDYQITPYEEWNIGEFEMYGNAISPYVEGAIVNEGGGKLAYGQYRFAVEVMDDSGNVMSISDLSGSVVIGADRAYYGAGAYNLDTHMFEDGAMPLSRKSITIKISNLDTRYDYYRIIVYVRDQGQEQIAGAYKLASRMPIVRRTGEFTLVSITEADERVPTEYISTRPVLYETSQDMDAVENRLVRFNITEKFHDWSGWQAACMNIRAKPLLEIGNEHGGPWAQRPNKEKERGYRSYSGTTVLRRGQMKPEFKAVLDLWQATLDAGKSGITPGDRAVGVTLVGAALGILPIPSKWFPSFLQGYALEGRWKRKVVTPLRIAMKQMGLGDSQGKGWWFRHDMDYNPIPPSDAFEPSTGEVEIDKSRENFYFSGPGFMPDEVYAIGIKYKLKGGLYSPVFHIPGRKIDPGKDELEIVSGTDDARVFGEAPPLWKVKNTGFISPQMDWEHNTMAYHESDSEYYPLIRDKLGYVFAGGIENDVVQKVRHHHFPLYHRSLGLYLYDIPTDEASGLPPGDYEIESYQIMVGKPSYSDMSVIDFGLVKHSQENISKASSQAINVPVPGIKTPEAHADKNVVTAYSPELHLGNMGLSGTGYIRTYSPAKPSPDDTEGAARGYQITYPKGDTSDTIAVGRYVKNYDINENFLNSQHNFRVKDTAKISPYSQMSRFGGQNMLNYTSNEEIFMWLDRDMEYADGGIQPQDLEWGSYVFFKQIVNAYPDLFSIIYYPSTEVYSPDNHKASTYSGDAFWGDWVLSPIRKGDMIQNRDEFFPEVNPDEGHDMMIVGMSYISRVNAMMRHGTPSASYVLETVGDIEALSDQRIDLAYKVQTKEGFEDYGIKAPKSEAFAYNPDYSIMYDGVASISLNMFYRYGRSSVYHYPNNIVWSEPRVSSNATLDPWRVNLANNFTTVGEQTGAITAGDYIGDTLVVRTERGCWYTKPSNRNLKTGAESVFVGEGAFLGMPFYEVSQSVSGFAGQRFRTASVLTENGLLWVDSDAGRVFMWKNGGIHELSNKETYMMSDVLRAMMISPSDIHVGYDPFYERAIIFKYASDIHSHNCAISFSFRENDWNSFHSYFPLTGEGYTYVIDHWHPTPEEPNPIPLVSPQPPMSDSREMYTIYKRQVYRHDVRMENKHCNFYGRWHDFAVEYIVSNLVSHDLQQIKYYAYTQDRNLITGTIRQIPYPTFSSMVVYSADQSTGIIPLEYDQGGWSKRNVPKVVHAEQNYNINNITDVMMGGAPYAEGASFTRMMLVKQQWPYGQGFTDKAFDIIDPADGNPNTEWKEIPLKGKFHYVRLYYRGGYKITFDSFDTEQKPSDL